MWDTFTCSYQKSNVLFFISGPSLRKNRNLWLSRNTCVIPKWPLNMNTLHNTLIWKRVVIICRYNLLNLITYQSCCSQSKVGCKLAKWMYSRVPNKGLLSYSEYFVILSSCYIILPSWMSDEWGWLRNDRGGPWYRT